MTKKLLCMCLVGMMFILFPIPVAATSTSPDQKLLLEEIRLLDGTQEIISEELEGTIPQDAKELLHKLDWDELELGKLISLSPQAFFKVICDYFKQLITAPSRILGKLFGILLLTGLMNSLKTSIFSGGLEQVFSVVSVVCTVSFLSEPIIDCIVRTVEALRECSLFILSFIPVFSGAVAAGGNPVTGGAYNMFLFLSCQVVSNIASETLIPLLSIYFALCIISPIVPQLKIDNLTSAIKSFVCWGLGVTTTVFVGLLSLQTIVSTGADSVTMKTSKFLMGSFIPVIGGVLSDALGAAQGYLKLIKSVIGSFGMLIAVGTFLPVLIQVVIWYGVVSIAAGVGKIMGTEEVTVVLKSVAQTLSILLATILCFILLIIVSTTIVLIMCVG